MDQVAFGLPVGNVSDPIPTSQGYYILKVAGKSESMPVIDEYRLLLGSSVFVEWLQEQRQAHVVEYLSQSNIVWALEHVD
jgi:parvulin-like peptidyl-prolyl isomerase